MTAVTSLEGLLRRDGLITVVSLFALWALTWLYIALGAGLGMSAWDMSSLALLPQQPTAVPVAAMPAMADMAMPSMASTWGLGTWTLMVAMWWTMMIAMMTPSAAPTILLYARVHRDARARGQLAQGHAPIAAFVAGYFLAWLAFSILATALHHVLQNAGILSPMMMGSQVRWVSGTTLVLAGLYQLSPLKHACLAHCRAPAAFLSRHWRPGAWGALRLGVVHGGYCLGCCWMLMALLFVGGVMNLAWIAALSLLVLAEKILAAGPWVGRAAAIVLIAWGVAILLG